MALIFGVDEGVITTVSGAVAAVASVVSYIAEGRIDAAAVANAIQRTQEAVEAIKEDGDASVG